MDFFHYRNGTAWCEDVELTQISKSVGTPAYIYSKATLRRHCRNFLDAFAGWPTLACFAVKANSNIGMLRELGQSGFGADVVSVGEMERALLAGIKPERIVYSGVGKRRDELERGIEIGIKSFIVESDFELDLLAQVATAKKIEARWSLRINPNIDAKTHPKISTGLYSTKFGITESDARTLADKWREHKHLRLVGIGCHIGSQITEVGPLAAAAKRMATLALEFKAAGHQLELLDVGGGLGIRYNDESPPELPDYARAIIEAIRPTGLKLVVEPGRVIVGNTGILLTSVLGVKSSPEKSFIIVDAAMNDLLRPSIYDAWHEIMHVSEDLQKSADKDLSDVVGPVCETGDFLGKDRMLARPATGDLMFVRSCGAYSSSMASNYNSRARAPEILVDGASWRVLRPREKLSDLWASELIP